MEISILYGCISVLTSAVGYMFKLIHVDLKGHIKQCEEGREAEKQECAKRTGKLESDVAQLQGDLKDIYARFLPKG